METTKHGNMEVAENIKPHSMSGQYSKDQTETEDINTQIVRREGRTQLKRIWLTRQGKQNGTQRKESKRQSK